jgi:hypothetical protein
MCTGDDDNGNVINNALRYVDLDLDEGEIQNCTFTNSASGSITIIKDAVPNDAEDFSFSTTGGLTPSTFDLDDDGDNGNTLSNTRLFSSVAPGMYTVTEGAETGFDLTNLACSGGAGTSTDLGMRKATIDLGAGENVTCTFTNTKRGAIKIVKNTVGGDGTFTFNPTGFNGGSSFDLMTAANTAMQTFENIAPGSGYSISETVPTGWDLTSFTCDNGNIGAITVAAGATTTCTATNTKRGAIKIVKNTVGGDGTFYITPTGFGTGAFNLMTSSGMAMQTCENIAPGSG